jgi:cytochrome c peroxidase
MHKKTILLMAVLLVITVAALFYFTRIKTPTITTKIEQAQLGHYLFFDTRLSFNNTKSCASCHAPQFAFSDGYRRSITASGDNVLHNAPSLINIGKQAYFNWADYSLTTLAQQHKRPLFNTAPVELGAKGNEQLIIDRLQKDSLYAKLFKAVFPNAPNPFSFDNIIQSIAAYVETLQSTGSQFDKYVQGDSLAMSLDARSGYALFNSKRLGCSQCHGGLYLTNATLTKNIDSIYFNTGLYNVGNSNRYPISDNGLRAATGKIADDGRFKVPSLRNIAITAPYMHDGSVAALPEVLDIYMRGGRQISAGPSSGDGANNTNKSKLIKGFTLSGTERKQLLAFFYALTDSTLSSNPVFQNPFAQTNN